MSRSRQHPVGKAIAQTRAKSDSILSGTEFHASKRGGYKAGENRYQTSAKNHGVTAIIRRK